MREEVSTPRPILVRIQSINLAPRLLWQQTCECFRGCISELVMIALTKSRRTSTLVTGERSWIHIRTCAHPEARREGLGVNGELHLEQIARSYRLGRFADGVLVALAKASAAKELREKDRQALREAARFLDEAKKGKGWVEDPTVSSDSVRCAVSFDATSRTIGRSIPLNVFERDVDLMLQTIAQVLTGKASDPANLDTTRRFFVRLLRTELDEFDSKIGRESGLRTETWGLVPS